MRSAVPSSQAGPRRSHGDNVRTHAFSFDSFGDPIQAEGVTPEDAQMLDEILSAGAFDDVKAKARLSGGR